MAGRARAAQAAKNNLQLLDDSWKKYADCGYCERTIMVNNYEDHKSRTPKFLGLVVCPWCDPRTVVTRWLWRDGPTGPKPEISNPELYRTMMSRWLTTRMARPDVDVAKLKALAEKLFA